MLDIMEIQNSTIVNGKGVFVQMHHKKGDIVFVLSGKIYDEPTRETIHIGNNKHIYMMRSVYSLITLLNPIYRFKD